MRKGTKVRIISERLPELRGKIGRVILGAVNPDETITVEVDGKRYGITGREVERVEHRRRKTEAAERGASKGAGATMFTPKDIGCYADGAFGHDHCRAVLADLIENIPENALTPEQAATIGPLADELRAADMSDDASEEDDALDLLNTLCEGCYFTFDSGDLLLVSEDEENS